MDRALLSTMALFSKDDENVIKYKGSSYSYCWFLYDLISVLFHLVFIVVISLPPIILPYYFELERGRYSLASSDTTIRMNDWSASIWSVWRKIFFAPRYTHVFMCLGLAYIVASLIDLAIYYCEMPLPSTTLRIFANVGRISPPDEKLTCTKLRKIIINTIEWVFLLLSLCVMVVYFALVCEWNILGAVLNPTAYIAYATIVCTFIVYVYLGVKSINDVVAQTVEYVKTKIQ